MLVENPSIYLSNGNIPPFFFSSILHINIINKSIYTIVCEVEHFKNLILVVFVGGILPPTTKNLFILNFFCKKFIELNIFKISNVKVMSNHLQEHVPSKAYLSLLYTGHVIEKLIKETESSQTYNL